MSVRRPLPSKDHLWDLLIYERHTGKLYWRARKPSHFPHGLKRTAEHRCANWNSKNAGKEAFTAFNGLHLVGAIDRVTYLAHRVIWKMIYGTEPTGIDHIDGDGRNNRDDNLREADQTVNSQNSSRSRSNRSGTTGVSFHAETGKWRAYITVGAQQHALGLFSEKDDAIAARKAAEHERGFHPNHGRAA